MASGTRYLVRKDTREVYPWMKNLAENEMFEPLVGRLPKIDKKRGLRFATEDAEYEDDDFVPEIIDAKAKAKEDDEMREVLFEAFDNMPKIEFATYNNMPRLLAIKKACGLEIAKEVRDRYFMEWKASKEAQG